MRKKRKEKFVLQNVEIMDVAAEGKALARVDDMVLFVPYVAPGDVVDVEVFKKRKNYMEGRVLKVNTFSALREKPFCEHFGTCGGCKWQHIQYKEQLNFKRNQVVDHFKHIGKFDFPEVLPTFPSEKIMWYRNKLEFTFSDRRWFFPEEMGMIHEMTDKSGLGFHIPGMFDKILDLKHCYLQTQLSDIIRLFVRQYAVENQLSFYNVHTHEGFLRNLIIRDSNTHDWMVLMVFGYDDQILIAKCLDALMQKFPQITSLCYVINEKWNDSIQDLEAKLYHGQAWIEEKMPAFGSSDKELRFKIGPKSFFQTNSQQAYELYRIAAEFASFKGDELVYDLYTGTGTIAQFVAGLVKKVIGIEYVEEAIADAKENAALNRIDNAEFFAGDMAEVLNDDFVEKYGKPDVIITDPPRAGMHEKVVQQILKIQPEKIVYVSCNSATQARDIAWMQADYEVKKIQPVDMFPHTHHVENVCLLEKKVN